jgi:Winged helix DNA-binding domain
MSENGSFVLNLNYRTGERSNMGKRKTSPVSDTPEASFTWDQVLGWRLRKQFLDRRAPKADVLAVTRTIAGLHAQVMSSAELTLWARVDDLDRDMVQKALWTDRTLVKSWVMRGTLHLFASDDYPIYQATASRRRNYYNGAFLKYFNITVDELNRLYEAIGEVLRGQVLTREELGAAVAKRTGDEKYGEYVMGSWGSLLKPAAYRGELCFGPSTGQRVCFTRPDEWLPEWHPVDPHVATSEVTRRFLATYGPATRDELRLWWGVYAGDANKMLASLDGKLSPVEIEGIPALALTSDLSEIEASTLGKTVRLLPAFDQYVIAAPRNCTRVIPVGVNKRIYRNQGWLSPVLLVNGQMAGVWRHERKGAKLLVQIEPFFKIPTWAKKSAEREAERLAKFLGGSLELAWVEA